MPGRTYSANSEYRYGFNGQEKSTEIDAGGNSMTAEFWQYDSRIGRRWNVDPVSKEWESPYATFSNNPIFNIDPDGDSDSSFNAQMLDAVGSAVNLLREGIKKGKRLQKNSKEMQEKFWDATTEYVKNHDLTVSEAVQFKTAVESYYNGLWVFSSKGLDDIEKIAHTPEGNDKTKLFWIVKQIIQVNKSAIGVITIGANVALGEGAGAVGVPVGPKPKGVQPRWATVPTKNGVSVEVAGGKSYIYRGDNGDNPLFKLKGGEYKYSENTIRGLSLHVDAAKLTNARGAAYQLTDMPAGLKIVQQGKDIGHYEIIPTSQITQEQFQSLLNQIKYTKVQ